MIIGGINLGNLPLYLLFYSNGSVDANWQGASKGFVGDVAVDGIQASERTSGFVPYAGTIYTNDNNLGAWQQIVDANPGQAFASYNEVARIAGLETDLVTALQQINALTPNPSALPAPYNIAFDGTIQSLDGLNTQNGINEVFVLDITSGFGGISTQINITGDAGDVFIFRWDTDANPANGYQGQVKFQSGGAIVPHGGLKTTNFINAAGDIGSSGGGSTPPPPYPQGPRYNDGLGPLIIGGQDFSGGGFFSGYWLTTGSPDNFDPATGLWYGGTSSLSNAIFAGGWYSITDQFSMTSGTSGVYVSPPTITDQPAIDVEKEVSPDNGVTWFDADTPPGPNVVFPTNPQFRFTVTNTGNVTLSNVVVTDDVFGLIGTLPSLAPGASASWIIVGTWAPGQHVDTATATAQYSNIVLTDSDPAHYFGVEVPNPAIDVEKEVSPDNGITWFDADTPPGPSIPSGITPVFRFIVTNTGNVTLTNVTLTDTVFGPIVIPTTTLAPGEFFIVTTTEPWTAGQHTNVATVTGTYNGQTVTDSDPAHYFGPPEPAIDVEKEVSPDNGVTWFDADTPPGPSIPSGITPVFRFIVRNTGNVTLTNVTLTDTVFGPIAIPTTTLAPGAFFIVTTTEPWTAGQHVNVATVTGQYNGTTVTDSDSAHYFGLAAPAIDIEKYVSPDNGATWVDADFPPGPTIPSSISPQFRFVVTNTGDVTLTNVVVNDDVFGLIGTLPSLAPGASFEWIIVVPWALGQHVNNATVTGQYNGTTVTDTDPAHYVGEQIQAPAIDVEKLVSPDGGITFNDADLPPGPTIQEGTNPIFRYIVTNIGNVTLNSIVLTDDVFGPITIPTTTLASGAFFEVTTTQPWAAGQHTNVATVTGTDGVTTVTDSDPANYFGLANVITIDLEKEVSPDNGVTWFDADTPTGPIIPSGITPVFRFIVRNTGNVTLSNIVLTDDVFGTIAIPTTTLTPGAFFEVTTTEPWTAGQHTNNATVTGEFNGTTVTDTDPANYFGLAAPAIDVEKEVSPDNGITWFDADTPPGPSIPSSITPVFRFRVTNIGDVTLSNIILTDDVFGTIAIPTTTLASGEFFEVTTTEPWTAGQHTNNATVTGEFNGTTVTDTDPANYFGLAAPAIEVVKYVSVDGGITWFDANTPPYPNLVFPANPMYRFVVTNIGDVELTQVTLTDTDFGVISLGGTLAPGGSFTTVMEGTFASGQHCNTATATGVYVTEVGILAVEDTDPACFVGVAGPAIDIEKFVSVDNGLTWIDADTAPGPLLPDGVIPQFRFVVTNIGTVPLTNIQVADTRFGPIGTLPLLNPGGTFEWIRIG